MKTYLECIPCFLNQAVYMARMGTADEKIQKMIIDDVAMAIPQFGLDDSPPEMARRIHQIIERHLGPQDFYKDIKYTSNVKALEIYPHLKAMVKNASDRLLKAVEVAIVGNVIDYGAKNTLDIEKDVERFLESDGQHAGKTIFDYDSFKDDLNRAKTVLYLGDNAGETVFDRVLIETVPSDKRIIFAVREKPVINDALIEDAVMSGIDKTAEIISSGGDAPGTILGLCSRVFNEVFTSADMVISKGQGNYETLTGTDRPIYFLFRAKCPVIARHAGVPIGDLVLMKGGAMNIQILYDSEAAYEGLKSGWGFSCLVDGQVLFDTGENGESLGQNVKTMAVDMSSVETVVISHDHWDHIGGLEYVVENASNLKKIYICPGFDPVFKQKAANFHVGVIEADHFTRITNRVYSTGQILCSYKEQPLAEQALILQTNKGFSVVTGCAHPGIVEILKKVKSQLSLKEFYTVIGGFHLKNHTPVEIEKIVQEFIALKVRRVAPIHCTGLEAQNIFKKVYGDRCFMLKIGEKVEV